MSDFCFVPNNFHTVFNTWDKAYYYHHHNIMFDVNFQCQAGLKFVCHGVLGLVIYWQIHAIYQKHNTGIKYLYIAIDFLY